MHINLKTILQIQNLAKTYPKTNLEAVKNINLEMKAGELLAVVGESGSGKSTLLRMIAGLEEPSKGNILLNGKKILPPSQTLVAGNPNIRLVFQDFRLLPNHKVIENLEFSLRNFNAYFQKEKINELLSICKLEGLELKYPKELSGGQQQRLAIAKALATEPELLLLDEPFSNLDLILKNDLKNILRNLNTSLILVTHDAQEALSIADRIAVMQKGEILQWDTPENIYKKPKNEYIALLFGNANIVSQDFLNEVLHFDISKKACIRFENISVAMPENFHFQGTVMEFMYLGFAWQVSVLVNEKFVLQFWSKEKPFEAGDLIALAIAKDKIWFFDE